MDDLIRYDLLQQYAQENRLDYNELCRVIRIAAEPSMKDSRRYRWLTKNAWVGDCYTEDGVILEVMNTDRRVPIEGTVDEAIDAALIVERADAAPAARDEENERG